MTAGEGALQFLGLPPVRKTLLISEAAVSILLAGEPKMRVHRHEVNVQTLVSSTIIVGQAIASKIFKVYAPTLFVRRVDGKIMLGGGRPLADSSDVLSDLSGQIVYMMRVPGIILICAAGFGKQPGVHCKAEGKAPTTRSGLSFHTPTGGRPVGYGANVTKTNHPSTTAPDANAKMKYRLSRIAAGSTERV